MICILKEIRNFLKGPSVELVGLDSSAISGGDAKMANEVLGPISFEPILVAKGRNAVYYADDAPMRSLAFKSYGVASFSTQALLRTAKEKRILTAMQYEDAVTMALLRNNYHFVSESYETLARIAESEQFELGEFSKQMLERLFDPSVDHDTSIRVLSDFSLFIWRSDFSKSKATRELWLGLCLEAMLRANQKEKLFIQFVLNLGIRALSQPSVLHGITHSILRSGKLSKTEHDELYFIVQQVIPHLVKLSAEQFGWLPHLQINWREIRRINILLKRNGWI